VSRASLSSRLATLQQALAAAVMLAFAVSALWVTERTLAREERAMLGETAGRIAGNLDREYSEEGSLSTAARDVMEEESASGVRIEILDPAGVVLASSDAGPSGSGAEDRERTRVTASSQCGATVVASVSSRLRKASVAALTRGLLVTAVPVLLLAYVASRALTRRALRPLSEMGRRARDASAEESVRSIGPASGFAEIDELRESFDRLLCRLDDLLRSERRFAADASHELRTPLTVLSGEIELALAREDLPVTLRVGLARAAEQALTVRDLVDALLLLRRARPEPGEAGAEFEPVNLSDVARDVLREAVARSPARSPDVEVAAPDEVLVAGSPALLASAVRNVIDNALKFTREGQAIRVSVDGGTESRLTVDDGGAGIPASERDRVFDPFYRGPEARAGLAGLGLGLPILRQVVRAHRGEVAIEDSPLGGARVVLRFPAWQTR
jgi:signal transduction histidine kinase